MRSCQQHKLQASSSRRAVATDERQEGIGIQYLHPDTSIELCVWISVPQKRYSSGMGKRLTAPTVINTDEHAAAANRARLEAAQANPSVGRTRKEKSIVDRYFSATSDFTDTSFTETGPLNRGRRTFLHKPKGRR